MSKRAYEEDIIAALGEISGMHKLLYVTLWSRANEIGIVHVNLDQILALTGIRYQEEDFNHFGNRLVRLNDKEFLLSRFLQTTIGTLSKGMRGQKKIWQMIELRWNATKDHPQPFYDAWNKLGIGFFAPPLPDEYIGEDNLPPRLVKYRNDLLLAGSVDTPCGWPERVAKEFKSFIDHRIAISMEKTGKAETDSHRIVPSQVMTMQEIVQDMINDGLTEKKIIHQIRYSKNGNKFTIFTP